MLFCKVEMAKYPFSSSFPLAPSGFPAGSNKKKASRDSSLPAKTHPFSIEKVLPRRSYRG